HFYGSFLKCTWAAPQQNLELLQGFPRLAFAEGQEIRKIQLKPERIGTTPVGGQNIPVLLLDVGKPGRFSSFLGKGKPYLVRLKFDLFRRTLSYNECQDLL